MCEYVRGRQQSLSLSLTLPPPFSLSPSHTRTLSACVCVQEKGQQRVLTCVSCMHCEPHECVRVCERKTAMCVDACVMHCEPHECGVYALWGSYDE